MDYWQVRKLLNKRWELTTPKTPATDENINTLFENIDKELEKTFN